MSVEGEVAREEAHELHRALGPWQLIALGIGAIIGAGIFVITGHAAAAYAGPGVVISFIVAGAGCLFAGLCYAEFASSRRLRLYLHLRDAREIPRLDHRLEPGA
jgi:APA family basic amino acid/polyamine antiporter